MRKLKWFAHSLVLATISGALVTGACAATTVVAASATKAGGTTVFLYPVINGLVPYIDAAIGAVISALGAFAVVFLKQHFDVQLTVAQETRLESMAKTQAGIWVAKADNAAMNARIDVGSPGIAVAANAVIAAAPGVAGALGLTQADVQAKIVGEIGKLQAQAQTIAGAAA